MYQIVYEKMKIGEQFKKFVEKSGSLNRLKNARTIIIKPNFAGAKPWNSSATTAYYNLKEIADSVLEVNDSAIVYIAESDSQNGVFAYTKFDILDIPECLDISSTDKHRVMALDLTRDNLLKIENENFLFHSKRNGQLYLSEKLINADYLISMTNVKTHLFTGFSGACKNLFGCIARSEKDMYHGFIHKVIHDLNLALKPDVSIVDGFRGMQKNGPIKGESIDFGFLVMSDSAFEADIAAAGIVGIKPFRIKYLKLLSKYDQVKAKAQYPAARYKIKKPDIKKRVKLWIKRMLMAIGFKIMRRGF